MARFTCAISVPFMRKPIIGAPPLTQSGLRAKSRIQHEKTYVVLGTTVSKSCEPGGSNGLKGFHAMAGLPALAQLGVSNHKNFPEVFPEV